VKIDLPYLIEDVDRHGNVRLYVRRRGHKKIRIRALPESPEFIDAYREAVVLIENSASQALPDGPQAHPGTLEWLGRLYMTSAQFKRLGPSTQRPRTSILESVFAEPPQPGAQGRIGRCPLDRLTPQIIIVLRDRKAATPGAANNRLDALRVLFGWAIEHGYMTTNPAREVKSIAYATSGFHTWTIDEVRQYEATHPIGSRARLALALLLYTGTRRSDMIRLGRQHMKNGWLRFTVQKTRHIKPIPLEIPVLPQLQSVLDASPCGDLTFLVTEPGKPFTSSGFGNWFRARCDEAGLPHCTAHGLRKAGATIAAENGATTKQLMAIYGWESEKLAEVYTRTADRRKLAGGAMHLIIPERNTDD
jgi:integrase